MKKLTTLFEFDNVLTSAEINAEKARYMVGQLVDDLSMDKPDCQKIFSYDTLILMADIVADYVVRLDNEVKESRKLFNALFDEARNVDIKRETI